MPLTDDKSALRRKVREAFPGGEARDAQSRALCDIAAAWEPFRQAQVIAAYMPLPREADVTPLMRLILAQGRTLVLPRCEDAGVMTFRRVDRLEALPKGRWGFPEPAENAPVVPPEQVDLILVPLEAIDPRGMRLGKGGGYYDRILCRTDALTLGAALSHQFVGHVPAERHDIPLHAVVSAAGVQIFDQ